MKQNALLKDIGLALLRIVPSTMMLTHGIPKFQKLVAGGEIAFPDPIGISPVASLILVVIAEVLCPILLIVGFKTRWATLPPIITMLVAIFVVNARNPFKDWELPLLYLVLFGILLLLGPGKYSLDKK